MTLKFGNRELVVDMRDYVKNMLEEFPVKFHNKKIQAVGGIDLFKEDTLKKLDEHHCEIFHQTVAKALFLCKQARPDIQTVVAVLCSRVRAPGRSDWSKMVRLM